MTIFTFLMICFAIALCAFACWDRRHIVAAVSRITPLGYFRAELLVIAALLLFLGIVASGAGSASINVIAKTEYAEVAISPADRAPHWGQPTIVAPIGADLPRDCSTPSVEFADNRQGTITAKFYLLRPQEIQVAALGDTNDSFSIAAMAAGTNAARTTKVTGHVPQSTQSLGNGVRVVLAAAQPDELILRCHDGVRSAAIGKFRFDYVADGANPVPTLSLDGRFRIGGDVKDGNATEAARASRLLLSGTLAVEARSWPARTGRARSEVPLQLGDVVSFKDRGSTTDAVATGIIRAGDEALDVAAFSDAQEAVIDRRSVADAIPVAYAPTAWTRMQAMGEWAVLLAIGAILLYLAGAVSRLSDKLREER